MLSKLNIYSYILNKIAQTSFNFGYLIVRLDGGIKWYYNVCSTYENRTTRVESFHWLVHGGDKRVGRTFNCKGSR